MTRPIPRVCVAVMGLALTVSGCGFRPVHGERTAAAPEALAEVAVARIDDRPGQMMRNRLQDKMNPRGTPADPKYILAVKLTEATDRLALRRDATATRANLRITASYSLHRPGGERVFASTSSFIGSYNVLLNDFATLSAENDARRRVIEELSEDIKNRVAIYLSRPPAESEEDVLETK